MDDIYNVFQKWLFDGVIKSEIPQKDVFLSYKSPISVNRLISSFMHYGPLNHYLNKHFNNYGIFYLEKEDVFKFIKKCIIDFKVRRNNLSFINTKKDSNLFQGLRKKFPTLKGCDIEHLCIIIDRMDADPKNQIYDSLGLIKLEAPKKVRKSSKKLEKAIDVKVKDWLEANFSLTRSK